jgi:hypothetical protein
MPSIEEKEKIFPSSKKWPPGKTSKTQLGRGVT